MTYNYCFIRWRKATVPKQLSKSWPSDVENSLTSPFGEILTTVTLLYRSERRLMPSWCTRIVVSTWQNRLSGGSTRKESRQRGGGRQWIPWWQLKHWCFGLQGIAIFIFLFTLFLTSGARLPVLGPFHMGGAFGSNTWRGSAYLNDQDFISKIHEPNIK